MKAVFRYYFLLISVYTMNQDCLYGQTSPFALSPKWYFGFKAGLNFTAGAPTIITNGPVNGLAGQEGSSNICDPSGNVVFSSDSYRLYDGNNAFVQYLKGGTSSVQSSVCIPDPSDPTNKFYLFTANVDDNGGGEKPNLLTDLGIHYYQIQKLTSGDISVLAGPIKIADHNEVTEQICVSNDGNGNYWVITHQGGNYPPGWGLNKIFSWKVTASGVSARVVSSIAGTTGNNYWHGSMKINKCQDKLAAVFNDGGSPGSIEIYNWDNVTGMVTGLLNRIATGVPNLYGCEFSPSGKYLYYTSLAGNRLYQLDIASGTIYTDPTWTSSNNRAWMGGLQVGPDNKIYVINAGNFGTPSYIGVVDNPDVSGVGCNYNKTGLVLNAGPALTPNVDRGITNVSWLSPTLEIWNQNCPNQFGYNFKTYFNNSIDVVPGSEEWDFGQGAGFQSSLSATPSYTFTSDGNYNIRIRLKDKVCSKTWTSSKVVPVVQGCILPVEWATVSAYRFDEKVRLTWATASEKGNGYYIIERSTDGVNFTGIGKVKGEGTTSHMTTYEFYDESLAIETLYYRIKQMDYNGISSFSPVVAVTYTKFNWMIGLNQTTGEVNINTNTNETIEAHIYDSSGKEVLVKRFTGDVTLDNYLSSGVYLVKLILEDRVEFKKIVK